MRMGRRESQRADALIWWLSTGNPQHLVMVGASVQEDNASSNNFEKSSKDMLEWVVPLITKLGVDRIPCSAELLR